MGIKAPETHLQEIIGVLLLATGTLLLVSLLSYDPQDPSLTSVSSQPVIHNLAGKVGATVSDALLQGIGGGSYALAVVVLYLGWRGLFRRLAGLSVGTGLGYVSVLVFLPALIDLWLTAIPAPSVGWILQDHPGGVLGHFMNTFLTGYFNPVGAHIVIVTGMLAALMIVSSLSPLEVSLAAVRGGKRVASALWASVRLYRDRSRKWHARLRLRETIRLDKPKIAERGPVRPKTESKPRPVPKQENFEFTKVARGDYRLPPLTLLSEPQRDRPRTSEEELLANSRILEKKLKDFSISGRVTQVHPGPVITLYEFEPAPGVKVNQIVNLADDLALAMRAMRVRIVAPIPGKAVVGIEIPNNNREDVVLKEVLGAQADEDRPRLPLALGKDIFGIPVVADLASMPHLLVAGTTGSGKSVALNAMILSLLYSAPPDEVKFILIDPKLLELSAYEGIPHLLTPVVVKAKETPSVFSHLVAEMQNRYRLLAEAGVRNIEGYNVRIREIARRGDESAPESPLPYLVVVVDELADLMVVASRDIEESVTRLAQMARASGIHLVMATQRPSVDVLTGVIKANFPARIAFQVSSKTDSRTILDSNGAEQLLGRGDMLFLSPGPERLQRIHGAYVSEGEIRKVVDHIKTQASPKYVEIPRSSAGSGSSDHMGGPGERDDLYEKAMELVVQSGVASASLIQRRLRVGYPRAARMIEMMEEDGIVGPAAGGKPRDVYAGRSQEAEP
jgi:DNA segregation ATPase FtsK/SpoIIIE, S-DNA-T family